MSEDFPEEHMALLEEYGVSNGILYEYPSVGKLLEAILGYRRYAAWVLRTNNGDRLELELLVPASGKNKSIPKRRFDGTIR